MLRLLEAALFGLSPEPPHGTPSEHSPQISTESHTNFQKGLELNKAGDTRGALANFLQAHALRPTRVPYLLSAANMYLKLGQAEQALALYSRAESLSLSVALTEKQAAMLKEKRALAEAALLPANDEPTTLTATACAPEASPPSSPDSPPPPPPPPRGPSALQDGASAPTLERILGHGSYGTVWRGCDESHGAVAVKIVRMDAGGDGGGAAGKDGGGGGGAGGGGGGSGGGGGGSSEELNDEIELLQRAKHHNVVAYISAFQHPCQPEVWVIMELAELGSLHSIVKLVGPLAVAEAGSVMREALRGLSYLHEELHVLHRDIKAGNVLLTSGGVVKLADFGVSTALEGTAGVQHTVIGTPHWMAPEVISGSGYDAHADIWSIGILALELLEAEPPHAQLKSPMAVMFRIVNGHVPARDALVHGEAFSHFLSRCVVKEPSQRALCTELLEECSFTRVMAPSRPTQGATAPPADELLTRLVARVEASQARKAAGAKSAVTGAAAAGAAAAAAASAAPLTFGGSQPLTLGGGTQLVDGGGAAGECGGTLILEAGTVAHGRVRT